ncbi:phage tail protein [Escherichia coli]|uniref:phage tail protein n=1 Tax=Escherichia coli TaxID=562 RepID=UPI00156F02F5|nr:phage tail protein [Escherichia coli]
METFHWKVRPDMNVVSEPKVVTVKLGDGYEQRRAAGLNNQLSTYSVTIRVRKCDHPSLKAFCNQVNHLIPTRVLVKGGEITCKILK